MTDQSGSITFTTGVFPFAANGKRADVLRAQYSLCFSSGSVFEPIRDYPPLPRTIPHIKFLKGKKVD